jgi:hypothetical protein
MLFFNKKKDPCTVKDIVFMHNNAKWDALALLAKATPATIFICWFETTRQQLQTHFNAQGINTQHIFLYRMANIANTRNVPVVFAEHYPLRAKEMECYTALQLTEARVYSALEEPLFAHFGGQNIIHIMQQTGVNEHEALENPMISRALKNAQEKLAANLLIEQTATSQSDWFKRNGLQP